MMETNETCTDINSHVEKYYLTTMYSIVFIVGLIGNVTVISGYIFCLKKWKCSNIYLFSLSVTDLFFICTLPMFVIQYANDSEWHYGDLWCKFNRYFLNCNLYLSVLYLTCISIDRYLLVKSPTNLYRFQEKQTAAIICLLLWIFVTVELVPMFTFIGPKNITDNDDNAVVCVDYASSGKARDSLVYSLFLTIVDFILPLCIMGYCSIKTATCLREINAQRRRTIKLKKPHRLVILAVVIFSVLFTPYHIMRNIRIASRMGKKTCTYKGIKAGYAITRPIAYLSSAINPIFYFMLGDRFRETLLSKLPFFGQKLMSETSSKEKY
ncbi:succinate receptor 1-like isoform X2 [Stegostoma tigrinum]|uniref:succinate receptor 1-like isoform X2 n=1 Tax=Stegostoma tigrinum TaxID=3053191 RepID=UPI00202B4409|nr:succinate receptor 1-like isoform X2 [Stegostoma tigrinum]